MGKLTNEFIEYVSNKNVMQEKYLKSFWEEVDVGELGELEDILAFFSKTYSIEEIGDAYLLFVEDTMNETKYCVENNSERYRFHSLDEVEDKVYGNAEYMSKYMLGLQISGYVWSNHREIHRWWKNIIPHFNGENYLEIGPGHGQYFLEALEQQRFKKYYALDISETSLKQTKAYIDMKAPAVDNFELIQGDFYKIVLEQKFDAVSLSEVLEHVEEPERMMRKVYEITSDSADVYVNVPINAPEIDHIYLFHNVEEVISLIESVGFIVKDKIVATGNGIPYEKAVKKKSAINLALWLKKQVSCHRWKL